MKLEQAQKKSNLYICFGLISLTMSSLFIVTSILKSFYVIFKNHNGIDIGLSGIIIKIINLVYSYTYKIPFAWEYSPMFDPHNIGSKENYYFAAIAFIAAFSYGFTKNGFSIKAQIAKENYEADNEILRRDIRKSKGIL